jgi:hypothetical protein
MTPPAHYSVHPLPGMATPPAGRARAAPAAGQTMIRIAITVEAFDAIAATLPLGSVTYEPQIAANGERWVWLPKHVVDKLAAMRGRGEGYSDVIIRLAKEEGRA